MQETLRLRDQELKWECSGIKEHERNSEKVVK